ERNGIHHVETLVVVDVEEVVALEALREVQKDRLNDDDRVGDVVAAVAVRIAAHEGLIAAADERDLEERNEGAPGTLRNGDHLLVIVEIGDVAEEDSGAVQSRLEIVGEEV